MNTVHQEELKKKRGSKKSLFTRACNKAESLIVVNSSRADIEKAVLQIDDLAGEVDEVNEELLDTLTDDQQKHAAQAYSAEIRRAQQEIKRKIQEYFMSRADDSKSVASSSVSRSSVSTNASANSRQLGRQAEVAARVKRAAVRQLREQLALEREEERIERERIALERKQRLKRAEDAAKLSELEARLQQAAENDLEWERLDELSDSRETSRSDLTEDGAAAVPARGESACMIPATVTAVPSASAGAHDEQEPPLGVADELWAASERERQHLSFQRPASHRSVPQIQLPRFNGSSSEWPRWIGLFKTLVHGQAYLSDAEKMAHLQSSVTGLARQLIEGMLFDGSYYQAALDTLTRRFGREEDIVRANLAAIFDAPPVRYMDVAGLEKYQVAVHCAVKVLQNMGFEGDLLSSENLRRALAKIPSELRREWGKAVVEMEPARPSLVHFSDWLDKQVRIGLNSTDHPALRERQNQLPQRGRMGGLSRQQSRPSVSSRAANQASVMAATGSSGTPTESRQTPSAQPRDTATCACDLRHMNLSACPLYMEKTKNERARFVAQSGRCFSCLELGHQSRRCESGRQCGEEGCVGRHHYTLHGSARVLTHLPNAGSRTARRTVAAAMPGSAPTKTRTLLQVVPIRVMGSGGKFADTFALLDSGAQISLCSEDILTELEIDGQAQSLCLDNVEGSGRTRTAKKVSLELRPLSYDATISSVTVSEVWSVPALNVPSPKMSRSERSEWKHIQGLDIRDVSPGQVKVLLGANISAAIIQKDVRIGKSGQPVAIKTDFGWALSGTVAVLVPPTSQHVMHVHRETAQEEKLDRMLREWWQTDSFGTRYNAKLATSEEDRRAVELLKTTTKWRGNRYETGLLWCADDVTLPYNYAAALDRLERTEKSLRRSPEKAKAYQKTFDDYIGKGYAKKLNSQEQAQESDRCWFLPHHAVTSKNKPGKIRVVFDAAATYAGVSLNTRLLTGPDLSQSSVGILLRFRQERIGMAADIEEMFHQIAVREADQAALRFLWRDMESERTPDVYQMDRVIFGARSSPASAAFVLNQTAEDSPTGTRADREAIRNSFYADDFVRSEPTVVAAVERAEAVTAIVGHGGFRLTKWISNSRDVLANIPASERASSVRDLPETLPEEKVLGIFWNTHSDTITLQVPSLDVPATKRGILKQVASIFDPLGLAAPFLLVAKVLVQRLWTLRLEWDTPVTGAELEVWKCWKAELKELKWMQVHRCYEDDCDPAVDRQLHVFCDASETAFGAVAYLRVSSAAGRRTCSFVMCKTRVAPLRKLSVVRLELQAAVLAVRLADTVSQELSMHIDHIFFWSDSTVVLQYIASSSRRFHTFVANRVAEIQDSSDSSQWRHVPGQLNPADCCSRGLSQVALLTTERWFNGPAFLIEDEEHWPAGIRPLPPISTDPEVKLVGASTPGPPSSLGLPDPSRFSSYLKYKRTVVWELRFIRNLKARINKIRDQQQSGPVTVAEMERAELLIIRQIQADCFGAEIDQLRSGKALDSKSCLLSLSPQLDSDDKLRVGGRLANAPLDMTARHPVILPRESEVTRLIIAAYHKSLMHAGAEHVVNDMRQKFWVPRARAAVRRVLAACPVCRRRRAQPQPPRLADLPAVRFDSYRAFHNVGIDFFGPLLVKNQRRTEKRFCLLVTCLATRAIHLELTDSLDTQSFLMAFRRFVARRGKPARVYSDNGKSFKKGEKELRSALLNWNQAHLSDELSQEEIEWHFTTPASPHMGGVWERMVASVKRALRAVLGRVIVSEETLHTVIAEAEFIVNSRPLTHVSADGADLEAITPNHLLLGRPACCLPPGLFDATEPPCKKSWRRVQCISDQFWKRWLKEYVPCLTQRRKWQQEQRNLQIGDLVLLVGDNVPRGLWPLARVARIFPGADGRVRSVELRCRQKVLQRPVSKVCLLEEAVCAQQ